MSIFLTTKIVLTGFVYYYDIIITLCGDSQRVLPPLHVPGCPYRLGMADEEEIFIGDFLSWKNETIIFKKYWWDLI